MTREDVIRGIIARESGAQRLMEIDVQREDRSLHEAGCALFGTWETALRYAGVSVSLRNRTRKSWNREIVIAALQTRDRQRLPIRGLFQHDRPLYCAARRYFGSLGAALLAAGIEE